MITPRPYLSWSSMDLLERNIEKWKLLYFQNIKMFSNSGMDFGRKMADALENEEASGDIILDLLIERIEKFEIRDKIFVAKLKYGKKEVPILIKMDTTKKDFSAFKEYKSGVVAWTQSKADKSGQVTFYATGIYLLTGKIPEDIELVWAQTFKNDDGEIQATGEIKIFKTKRTMADVLKMMIRMKNAWALIEKISEEEYL